MATLLPLYASDSSSGDDDDDNGIVVEPLASSDSVSLSSSSSCSKPSSSRSMATLPAVCAAPELAHVAAATATDSAGFAIARYDLLSQNCTTLTHNVPYDAMSLPVLGPENPMAARNDAENARIGTAESFVMDEHVFRQQLRAFHRAEMQQLSVGGCSRRDNQTLAVSSVLGVPHIDDSLPPAGAKRARALAQPAYAPKRKSKGDPAVLDGENAYVGPWADYEGLSGSESEVLPDAHEDDEQLKLDEESDVAAAKSAGAAVAVHGTNNVINNNINSNMSAMAARIKLITPGSERTVYHAKVERDYQGRTYMSPLGSRYRLGESCEPEECFIPKKCIYTMRGHSKGVNAIRLLPRTAHLLLSASMDCKVKIWNVADGDDGDASGSGSGNGSFGRRGAMLRTYLGHNKAVRDINFDSTGARFLSASYDRYIKLWDTESGKCISCYTTGKLPNCVTFFPSSENENIFLSGQSDNKIYQFDLRTGNIVQEYNQHLGPVNTVTFVDNNRRFVTTSDDRSLRAWEFGIPVVIKYIAEPHMHSMPAVSLSPNKKWLACQSLDNQIMLYSATDKFRLNRQKGFRGHVVAGYACQVNFSPDSRFIMSGDSLGQLSYWDFKSCRMLKKQKAHDNVVMGCVWHPYETSRVFTCSWDNTIKIWD